MIGAKQDRDAAGDSPAPITEMLAAARRGEAGAENALYGAVYDRLRQMAGAMMRGQSAAHTLQPTALVHEAYLKLLGAQDAGAWENRRHFLGCAAKAMRSILVDSARSRGALKRGGGRPRVTLEDPLGHQVYDPDTVLSIHEALEKLGRIEPECARVVELRFFAGLGLEEAAGVMDLSRRSACRRWDYARLWLFREIAG
jgi:RNA polymerase sigma factor (TIGR02999 family)